jgi:hypothetical protein
MDSMRDETRSIETENIEVYRISTLDTVVTDELPYRNVF